MRSDNKSSTKPEPPSLDLPQWGARYVIITGPTASGKSALALALAKRADGVIINADSMQLYADLQVLTARPDDGALRYAPHRLYGVIDGAERASVGSWLAMAAEAMAAARAAGKLPIIIGGTGMYINAGLNGLAKIPDVPRIFMLPVWRSLQKWAVMRFSGRSWQTSTRLAPSFVCQ